MSNRSRERELSVPVLRRRYCVEEMAKMEIRMQRLDGNIDTVYNENTGKEWRIVN